MVYRWETKKEKILKGLAISPEKKLEGMRLLNELTDKVLSFSQKRLRRRLRAL
jgi:hypothetical protein